MTSKPNPAGMNPIANNAAWKEIVLKYQKPSRWRASWQIINTIVPYGLLWYLMYLCRPISWWLVLPLAVMAGALLVRVFIIFHDCGHGSFFKSTTANNLVGLLAGILTFTPYYLWRWEHAIHHASSGDLDQRGTGDVWTMTVQEYLESSRWKKFAYRLARNPFILFVIAPFFLFVVKQRIPSMKASVRERHSVYAMDLAILGMAAALSLVFGFIPYLIIQSIILMVAGGAGVWMFYVQHQFEDVYWERGKLEFYGRSLARQFVLQTASNSAMVLRQHRFSSHSPSQPADSGITTWSDVIRLIHFFNRSSRSPFFPA